ncbi:hypothetical protein F511_34614 [Dorcoceras hygrometricum]|uniref:Uncharacterized protein n=1 Tax=Dorcoceras hygrometricum TaxID=472368 RepID=A0A2Z7B888_9LAMI|nr:hypothetical protein F511_34614 [Dorcoceras hygrometricum]
MQSTVARDWIHCSLRLVHHLSTGCIVACDLVHQLVMITVASCWFLLEEVPAGFIITNHRLNLSAKAKRCRIHLSTRHRFAIEMAPSVHHTRAAAAALRMKQIALDNQSRMIRCLRAKREIERRESAATKEGLETKLVEANKECKTNQVVLEVSHKAIAGLTEIGLCMSKNIERMKAKKQQARESHMECHHKLQACIQEAEDTIQEQHLIIEALLE